MILAKNLRKGNTFMHDGKIQVVLENSLSKKARGSSVTKLKIRSLEDNAIRIITFLGDAMVKQVILDKTKFTYLYSDDKQFHFMNTITYEQFAVPKELLEWEWRFLAENVECELIIHDGKYVGINLPEKVKLKVIEAVAAVKGDSVNNPQKDIIVETNYQLKAPLFIKQGEYVIVKTCTGKYDGKG